MALCSKMSGLWTAFVATTLVAGTASAQSLRDGLEIIGVPTPNGINLQPGVTEVARDIRMLDSLLLVITTVIVLFVTALLAYTIIRHNRSANPVPATFTHNRRI